MALGCFWKEKQVYRVDGCQGSRKACAGLKEMARKIPATSLPAFPSHLSAHNPLWCISPPVKQQQWWLGQEGGVMGALGKEAGEGVWVSMKGP